MIQLFNFFVDLCLLRRGPQDLPASTSLFWLLVLLNVLVGTAVAAGALGSAGAAFVASVLDSLLMAVLLYLVLSLRRRLPRFAQTASALFGAGALLGLLALPLQWLLGAGAMAGIGGLLYLALVIWIQVVIGHVLRHALEVPLIAGVGLALLYSLISGLLIQGLFPLTD